MMITIIIYSAIMIIVVTIHIYFTPVLRVSHMESFDHTS